MSCAIATNEVQSVWRVYCNVCRKDLGTMTVDILEKAMIFAIEKGGVMCPECRTERCKECGIKPRYALSEEGECIFCGWDKETWEPSCLVNQKSTIDVD